MPATIEQMIEHMHSYRDQIEAVTIAKEAARLQAIFGRAEVKLADLRDSFRGLAVGKNGELVNSVANIQEAARIITEDVQPAIERTVIGPGKQWARRAVPIVHREGRALAHINLDVEFISPEMVDAAFKQVVDAEGALVVRGMQDTYKIVNTVGADVGEHFRRQLVDSVVEGIPVQGVGDTLENRLFESGRLKPVTIRTESGKIITRSIKTRATAIARVESAKIINATHETLTEAALGEGAAVYINSNPEDSRTTKVCADAAGQDPMTLLEWGSSSYGRPPRLNPFHLCRSTLIGGRADWFADTETPVRRGGSPKPAKPKVPPKSKAEVKAKDAAAQAASAAAREFVPAKTREEFIERIKPHTGSLDGALVTASLEVQNAILHAAEDTLGRYGVRTPQGIGFMAKAKGYGVAIYSPMQAHTTARVEFARAYMKDATAKSAADRASFAVKKKKAIARIEEDVKRFADEGDVFNLKLSAKELEDARALERWSTLESAADPAYACAKHEFYHVVDAHTRASNQFATELSKMGPQRPVSDYARANLSEKFAETGTAIDIGLPVADGLRQAFEAATVGFRR